MVGSGLVGYLASNLAQGLLKHFGRLAAGDQVAPVDDDCGHRVNALLQIKLLLRAHGAGTLGKSGRGTAEFLGVTDRRLLRTITLSKAFGVYGGAIIGSVGAGVGLRRFLNV